VVYRTHTADLKPLTPIWDARCFALTLGGGTGVPASEVEQVGDEPIQELGL
jgi:hypothetical protein